MKKAAILMLALAVLMSWVAEKGLCNGGPLDDYTLKMNGSHEFKNVRSIQLVQEDLQVRILGDDVEYQVTYEFLNHGEAATMQYGFPVYVNDASEGGQTKFDPKDLLKSFQMTDSNQVIPCKMTAEKKTYTDADRGAKTVIDAYGNTITIDEGNHGDEMSIDDYTNGVYTVWNRAQLVFSGGERKTLKVDYRVKAANEDMIFSKSFRPSYSDRKTNYSFAGAKYWGDGKVEKLTVSIDDHALRAGGGKILSVSPDDYVKDEKGYHEEYQNVMIGSIPRLMVTYDNEDGAFSKYVETRRVPRSAITQIKASSTLAPEAGIHYDAENLLDDNPETAWVEGKGAGVTLEVWVKGYSVNAVGILNGYTKSRKAFEENSEPSKIHLEVQDEAGNTLKISGVRTEASLTRMKYKDFDPKHPIPSVDWIGDFGDGFESTGMIRLVIQDTTPGTQYKDTAISKLYLLGYPMRP